MSKYLDRLKAKIANAPTPEAVKTDKSLPVAGQRVGSATASATFGSFVRSQGKPFAKIASPPLDAEGIPCGLCPRCGVGEFWRLPKFHPCHEPRGWRCLHCDPIPAGEGPCDACGVPGRSVPS